MATTTEIGKGVTNMGGLGEAIYRNGMAQGMAEGKAGLVIDCMNATGCGVEEAVEKVVYDRNQRPAVAEAVNARLARERAGAELATA